jgi:alpha-beta hydrolase superfamily lysophospholipase
MALAHRWPIQRIRSHTSIDEDRTMAWRRLRRIRIRRLAAFAVINVIFTVIVAVLALFYGWASAARSLPDLNGWHREAPESEFTASDADDGFDFDDYLALEDEVFDELNALVAGPWSNERVGGFSRFRTGSVCNPETVLDRNWNRTFVFDHEDPIGGALLVHGLSDSPYSLRAIGQRLHREGFTVIGLRVPGHGTCPRALADADRADWMAAVRIAAAGLRDRLPDETPLILVGFSNGGALALDYATAAIEDDDVPSADAVILFSPMIGITPLAQLTRLFGPVVRFSGEEKAEWSSINAEIDPFKYSSWPMNASVQAWKMTQRVERRLARLDRDGRTGELPPILAVQSAVDSTVVVSDLIARLFDRLNPGSSELLLFDINRVEWYEDVIDLSFEERIFPAMRDSSLGFSLAVVTNDDVDSGSLVLRHREPDGYSEKALGLRWPEPLFSLSHGALPIPLDDPVYGVGDGTPNSRSNLGSLAARGESGVLAFSESLLVRLRYNPFYEFTEDHVVNWLIRELRLRDEENDPGP